jgi:hypothetical protein
LHVPGRVDVDQVAPLMTGVIEGFINALPSARPDGTVMPGDLTPGAQHMRDLEKAAGFLGATMAAQRGTGAFTGQATGFDVAAALVAFRDVLLSAASDEDRPRLGAVTEWLQILAMDSFATARAMSAEERMREQLEQGTPVVLVAPTVPAVLLVGAPDAVGLDTVMSRLLLLVVRVGAPAVILDATGLVEPGAPAVLQALGRFARHRKIAGKVWLIGVGLNHEQEAAWKAITAEAGASFDVELQFMGAVSRALSRAGYRIEPAPST